VKRDLKRVVEHSISGRSEMSLQTSEEADPIDRPLDGMSLKSVAWLQLLKRILVTEHLNVTLQDPAPQDGNPTP
jgi:hypothetical protein